MLATLWCHKVTGSSHSEIPRRDVGATSSCIPNNRPLYDHLKTEISLIIYVMKIL